MNFRKTLDFLLKKKITPVLFMNEQGHPGGIIDLTVF